MTPKVQVGTILIKERPPYSLIRQLRSRESNLPSRPLTAMPGEVFTIDIASVPLA